MASRLKGRSPADSAGSSNEGMPLEQSSIITPRIPATSLPDKVTSALMRLRPSSRTSRCEIFHQLLSSRRPVSTWKRPGRRQRSRSSPKHRCNVEYAKNQATIRLGKDWRHVLVLRSTTILSRGSRHRGQKAACLYRRPPPFSSAWRPGSHKQSACVQVL